ncbi:MAG: CBS domain-containing protein [Alphaproteobacteria bacterium]|uniref:CBS domain-containing protein n=1 Tax=Candidatus Nitrobium versatile TaxID=2884831 RepID=A0A953LZU6_9BACT|nr:CBS domain-containing protein [Candidatus Nitrobium versatile]
MSCITARDIMHPRMSIPAKDRGTDIVKRLLCPYPALPVVNENLEVIGIVSEYDMLEAVRQGKTLYEIEAQSIMSCGHAEHGYCTNPITVMPETRIEDVVEIMYSLHCFMLPVVEHKKLVGIIGRKQIINSLAETGFWPEHEFKMKVPSSTVGAGA